MAFDVQAKLWLFLKLMRLKVITGASFWTHGNTGKLMEVLDMKEIWCHLATTTTPLSRNINSGLKTNAKLCHIAESRDNLKMIKLYSQGLILSPTSPRGDALNMYGRSDAPRPGTGSNIVQVSTCFALRLRYAALKYCFIRFNKISQA